LKLLLKFCNTEYEHFNRPAYAMLDLVKKFEDRLKLADPKSITTHRDYSKYGPIALVAWLQCEHTYAALCPRKNVARIMLRHVVVANVTRLGTLPPTSLKRLTRLVT
jgi:hypothetical protein